ncbi:hypothetical protein ACO0RG_003702 [Hanseniaspora osmophila]
MSLSIEKIPNNFKTSLPPRKKAKTDEEKEQRRIERILRNRKAAHKSREKKRNQLKYLGVKCDLLVKMLGCVDSLKLKELDGCEEYIELRKEYEEFIGETNEIQTSAPITTPITTTNTPASHTSNSTTHSVTSTLVNSTTPNSMDMDTGFNTCSSFSSTSSSSTSTVLPNIKVEYDNNCFDNLLMDENLSMNNNLLMDENLSMNNNLLMDENVSMNNNLLMDENLSMNNNLLMDENLSTDNNSLMDENSTINNNPPMEYDSNKNVSQFPFGYELLDGKDNLFFSDDSLFLNGLNENITKNSTNHSNSHNEMSDIEHNFPLMTTMSMPTSPFSF